MNVFGIRPADEVLIIGAGNVGVIIAYQAAQAGVKVKAVIDILPKSAAYLVHAAKIRRMGIPILMRHTIQEAYGNGKVEGAIIYEVNDKFQKIEGSEKDVEVDGIWLAVGLTPSVEILDLMGAQLKFVPELGGYVPLRTPFLETTVENVYVAGDASCIEEASTAMMEGKIAGASAALKIGFKNEEVDKERKAAIKWLDEFRSSPHYVRIKQGLQKVLIQG
jgi:sarcosine oxidase subunit alpha